MRNTHIFTHYHTFTLIIILTNHIRCKIKKIKKKEEKFCVLSGRFINQVIAGKKTGKNSLTFRIRHTAYCITYIFC